MHAQFTHAFAQLVHLLTHALAILGRDAEGAHALRPQESFGHSFALAQRDGDVARLAIAEDAQPNVAPGRCLAHVPLKLRNSF